eukprot:m.110998 g.110998  ORF g.110998 m.110998 type:complete len:169 (+) comp51816_c0_seq5:680-1186(+)
MLCPRNEQVVSAYVTSLGLAAKMKFKVSRTKHVKAILKSFRKKCSANASIQALHVFSKSREGSSECTATLSAQHQILTVTALDVNRKQPATANNNNTNHINNNNPTSTATACHFWCFALVISFCLLVLFSSFSFLAAPRRFFFCFCHLRSAITQPLLLSFFQLCFDLE